VATRWRCNLETIEKYINKFCFESNSPYATIDVYVVPYVVPVVKTVETTGF